MSAAVAEVFRDLRWYLVFLLLVMWGFGCAFHIVFRHDQEESEVGRVGRGGHLG